MYANFEISRKISNIPPNFAGIFVRQLAMWGNLCALADASFVFWPVNVFVSRGSSRCSSLEEMVRNSVLE
jgi:hypothetical protein